MSYDYYWNDSCFCINFPFLMWKWHKGVDIPLESVYTVYISNGGKYGKVYQI